MGTIERALTWINATIHPDWFKHAALMAALMSALVHPLRLFAHGMVLAALVVAAAVAIGVAFERYQAKTKTGTPSWQDVVAGAVGGLIVALASLH